MILLHANGPLNYYQLTIFRVPQPSFTRDPFVAPYHFAQTLQQLLICCLKWEKRRRVFFDEEGEDTKDKTNVKISK